MADIEFTEEQKYARRTARERALTGITAWLIKSKLASNEKQANMLMLWVAGIAVAIAVITSLVFSGNTRSLSPEERAIIERSIVPAPRVR